MTVFSRSKKSADFSFERPVIWTRPAKEVKLTVGALTRSPSTTMARRFPRLRRAKPSRLAEPV